VHLADFPTAQAACIDPLLSQRMQLLREIASQGRAARMEAKLKVRQPLAGVTVILNSAQHLDWLQNHDSILKEEINVKSVSYQFDVGEYVSYEIQPNFKALGPRVGKLLPQLKQALGAASGAAIMQQLNVDGVVRINIDGKIVELGSDDIQVRLKPKEGFAAAQGANSVVVLATELTDELIQEGIVRDIVRLIQDYRKQRNLDFSDRIRLKLYTNSEAVRRAVESMKDYVCGETLATSLVWESVSDPLKSVQEMVDGSLDIYLELA
jgi:isoleucyl-tRNA synthetase